MSRVAHRAAEKASDSADFPSIPLPPLNSSSNPSGRPSQLFQPGDVASPESLLQTDIPRHEFAHALFSAIDLIPDVPYELDDYKPRGPAETPPSYPQVPNMKLLQPEFFRRYDASTLFYVSFYFPGTRQQYFAGRELKRRRWRFHTKYQTWFRRIAEPVEVTAEYEVCQFEYFHCKDADAWGIRQRNAFKLEYEYLEVE
jgi:CCR4-NOT transcription complex subunit 3